MMSIKMRNQYNRLPDITSYSGTCMASLLNVNNIVSIVFVQYHSKGTFPSSDILVIFFYIC